ncbi:MAG TPA: hypothetical protein VK563_13575 [Puia sp.]|nr:hypothetical protein [Puia sp.]
MIGAIPNPRKSFQIDKSANEINTALENLHLYSKIYRLNKANPLLKLYTFEATERLSLGVYIDVTFAKLSDSLTEVTIEVRRKIGSFDKSWEISNANIHITNISDLLSTSLTNDPTEKKVEFEVQEALKQQRIVERKQKVADEKANHPLAYYSKRLFGYLIFGLICYGVFRLILMMFS